jgi:hypothetical protein
MKVDLKSKSNKNQVQSVRSQIKDRTSLKKFDEFIVNNDSFDFDSDDHINALRKNGVKDGDNEGDPTVITFTIR